MIKHLVTGILTLSLALSGSGYGWANGLYIHNVYTSGVATQERISAPRSFTIKYNKLSWQTPLYKGKSGKLTYAVEGYASGVWSLLGLTAATTYKLTPGQASETSLYRVYAKTSNTSGPTTRALSNPGAYGANLISTPEIAPAPALGQVLLSQRGGAGSSVADLSWDPVAGTSRYQVETSVGGPEYWSLVRSTSEPRAMLVMRPGVYVMINIYALPASGPRVLVASSTYLGQK